MTVRGKGLKKALFVATAVAAVVSVLLSGCALGGGLKKDLPKILGKVDGVESVKVTPGYDGFKKLTGLYVGFSDPPITADQVRDVFVVLADEANFAGAGTVDLIFIDATSGEVLDLSEAIDELVERRGEPTGDYLPVVIESLHDLAGVSVFDPADFGRIADYMRG